MPVVAAGQVEDAIEQWLEDGVTEEQVGAAVDRIYELMDNPLNINDTAAVRDMPFMTPLYSVAWAVAVAQRAGFCARL